MPIERKLAAIMFTDIAGYTALSAKDENKALALLDKQKQILTPIIEEFNGTLHNKVGDGLLFTFPTVTDAIKCGIKIQKETKEIEHLNLRIGIHEGEITLKDGDALGDDVNVASRIDPFAAEGGIVISGKVQQNISSLPEFKTKFISEPLLKGVSQEVKVFCIISHGLPETDITKVTAKLEKDVKKLWFNQKSIIGAIAVLSILTIGIILWMGKNNWWDEKTPKLPYTPISKEELNAEKTSIILPYFDVRDEVLLLAKQFLPMLLREYGKGNEVPENYNILPLSDEEKKKIYSQLIIQARTTFYPDYNIFSYDDMVKAFEKSAKVPPNFKSFPTSGEIGAANDSLREKLLEPFSGWKGDTLLKIMNQIDNNQYSDKLLMFFNIFRVNPPIGIVEMVSGVEIVYIRIDDIQKNNTTNEIKINTRINSFFSDGLHSPRERLVPDIIDSIHRMLQKFTHKEFIASVESVKGGKVFIKTIEDYNLIKETKMEVFRQYIYRDEKSIQNRKEHIKVFLECCEINPYDWDCKNYEKVNDWSQKEYESLLDSTHSLQHGLGFNQRGLHKTILIEEVYDSIAVGLITENSNTCIKLIPGD